MTDHKIFYRMVFCLTMIFFFWHCFNGGTVMAQDGAADHLEENLQYQAFEKSVAVSLKTESSNLKKIADQLSRLSQLRGDIEVEINTFKTRHTTYVNTLLLPDSDVKELEKALIGSQESLLAIDDRLARMRTTLEKVTQDQARISEQYRINNEQLEEGKAQKNRSPEMILLRAQLWTLIKVLDQKKAAIETLRDFYQKGIRQFEDVRILFRKLDEKLDAQIKEKRRRELLERKGDVFSISMVKKIVEELERMKKEILFMLSRSFWMEETRIVWKTGGSYVLLLLLLFGLSQILFVRFRRFCSDLELQPEYETRPMLRVTLIILNRSLSLFVIAVFLFGYTLLRPVSPFVSLVLALVQAFLFTKWGLDLLRYLPVALNNQLPLKAAFMLRFLIHSMRYYVIIYVTVAYIINSDSTLLFIGRVFFEIGFVVWAALFGKLIKKENTHTTDSENKHQYIAMISICSYVVVIGALFFEVSGYGSLANYWYVSWGKSAVVIQWAYLIFFVIREWDRAHRKTISEDSTDQEKVEAPIKWLIVKVVQMAFVMVFIVSLIIAWGGRQAFLLSFFKVLNYSLTLGNMKISLLGCIYFILILFVTHTVVRLWRYFFHTRLLSRSGIEMGLQDSITTITVYLIWTIGVLISLHAIGLNTTSITVALGALGIGLGFGLQNIFNNFLSGIILLFERPIQVGDDLELNGVWGTVKKINVRSTVVQTYDNASLIIPNSELISAQVTNWSFKDKRLRRQITVGVAYGSDTELVRTSLLEAVDNNHRVLKYPKPDVIFTDFGDNALIFKLRFWTHIATFLLVETDVRFEIDRIFRERHITIAFPQRDVHVFYNE